MNTTIVRSKANGMGSLPWNFVLITFIFLFHSVSVGHTQLIDAEDFEGGISDFTPDFVSVATPGTPSGGGESFVGSVDLATTFGTNSEIFEVHQVDLALPANIVSLDVSYIGALAQAETGNEFFQLTLFLAEDAAGTNTNLSGGGRVNTGRLSFNASSDSSFSTFSQNFDITSLVSEGATHLRAVELKYRVESATVTAIQTAYIDDVSIEAVVSIPEPSTYALISIATLTFFVLRRKKR